MAPALALVVATAACASSGLHVRGLPEVRGAVLDRTQTLPTLTGSAFAGRNVEKAAVSGEHRAGCLVSEPWTTIGISADGRRLLLHSGGDFGLRIRYSGTAVRETATSAEVGVYLIFLKHGDGVGISAALFVPVVVSLHQPLGNRRLLHAATTTLPC